MIGTVILPAYSWDKVLETLLKTPKNTDDKNISIWIDIPNGLVEFSYPDDDPFAYKMDIQQTTLTEAMHFRANANSIITLFKVLDCTQSILMTILNSDSIKLQNDRSFVYVEPSDESDSPQQNLFELPSLIKIEPERSFKSSHEVNHTLDVSLQNNRPISFPHPTKQDFSFSADISDIKHTLSSISELIKEGGSGHMNDGCIFSFENDLSPTLAIYARKNTWFCSLSNPLTSLCKDYSDIQINMRSFKKLTGLCANSFGQIQFIVSDNSIYMKQPLWQYRLPIEQPSWHQQDKVRWLNHLPHNLYFPVSQDLVDSLFKINTAKNKKQALVKLIENPDLKKMEFEVHQNGIKSDTTEVYNELFLPTDKPISLSLWSLNTALCHFKSKIYWYYNTKKDFLVLKDQGENQYILLYANTGTRKP